MDTKLRVIFPRGRKGLKYRVFLHCGGCPRAICPYKELFSLPVLIEENYVLPSGSLVYMDQKVQDEWMHAIPKTQTDNGRLSLTFRRLK